MRTVRSRNVKLITLLVIREAVRITCQNFLDYCIKVFVLVSQVIATGDFFLFLLTTTTLFPSLVVSL